MEAADVEVAGPRAASMIDAFGGPVATPSCATAMEVTAEAMTNSVTNAYLIHILLGWYAALAMRVRDPSATSPDVASVSKRRLNDLSWGPPGSHSLSGDPDC